MTAAMRKDILSLARTAAFFVLSALVVGLVAYAIPVEIARATNIVENGTVEHLQLALLALGAASFAARAARRGETPRVMALCSMTLLAMAVRELDGALDHALWHGSWAMIDVVVAAAMVAVLLRAPADTLAQMRLFGASRRFPLFAAGIVAAVVFSQILGWKGIWNSIFDIPLWHEATSAPSLYAPDGKLLPPFDIPRHVKNTVEEGFELGSYLLLLFSAIMPGPRHDSGASGK